MQGNQFQSYGNSMEIKGRNWKMFIMFLLLTILFYLLFVISNIIKKGLSYIFDFNNIFFIIIGFIFIYPCYRKYQERRLIIDNYGIKYFYKEKLKFESCWIEIRKVSLDLIKVRRGFSYYSMKIETDNKKISILSDNFDIFSPNIEISSGYRKFEKAFNKIKEYQYKYKFEINAQEEYGNINDFFQSIFS